MAKKDVLMYYDTITAQYKDLLNELEDLESCGGISEDIINDVKRDIDIVKTNRDRWVYMMYLLDRPQRKSKAKKYDKCYGKKMMKEHGNNTVDDVVKENEEALERIRNI